MTPTNIQSVPSLQKTPAFSLDLQNHVRRLRKSRRGAAAVEFAIVLPVFVLLVFGMIEYGRMVMVQQVITNASREGARRAVLDGSTVSQVQDVVDEYLTNAAINAANPAAVSPNPLANADAGDPVTVTVSVPFASVSWLPSPMYLGGKILSASTTMRRESVE